MENPITNIKIAIRKLAEEGVPVKKLIDATKEAEGILESYGEVTRKEIYGFLNRVLKDKNVLLLVADRIGDNIPSMIPGWIAYLEKKKDPLTPEEKMNHPLYLEGFDVGKKVGEVVKEQKPAENPKWYDSMDEFYADALIEMVEKSDLIDRDKKNRLVWIEKHRAKPTEWSEEDEDTIEKAICVLEANFEPNEEFSGLDIKRSQLVERLGSLLPQPKQELSEFEEAIIGAFDKLCAGEKHLTPYTNHIKEVANELLELAREGYVPREEKWSEVETTARNEYLRGLGDGKAEALKDLPRWVKVDEGDMLDKYSKYLLRSNEGCYYYCGGTTITRDGYMLLVDNLEKLPKEGEI